jgi:hypothetical protein
MPDKSHNIPQIDDPYVGKVYGNLLDTYATPTYNLKLYMLRHANSVAAEDGIASYDKSLTSDNPGDIIILAQTGVTATIIDDLSIDALTNADGPNAIKLTFTITQPGAATFIDQLQLARAYLDQPNSAMPVVFLEIRFQGWLGSTMGQDDDEDTGGQYAEITDPIRWKLHLTKISTTINQSGSKYECEALPARTVAFTAPLYKIPTNISTFGKTITEHVKSLSTQLNLYHSQTAADHGVPDIFEFDLSELIAGDPAPVPDPDASEEEYYGAEAPNTLASDTDDNVMPDGTVNPGRIQDETVLTSADPNTDDRNRQMNETYAIGDAVEAKQAFVDAPKDEGGEPEKVFDEDELKVPKDMTIEKYFATLLSMNEEFYTKISRLENLDDPGASQCSVDDAYVYWFKMNAKVSQLTFDNKRNKFAHKIVYKPTMYKSSRPDIVVNAKEIAKTEEDYKSRAHQIFESGGLMKAYHYIFTGLNDQILSLDINYNNGIALMVPPLGGAIGQASIVLAEKAGPLDRGEDVTLGGVVENLIEAKANARDRDVFKDFMDSINQLKDIASDGLSGLVQQLEDATGLDVATITGALQDNNVANQKALELALTKNSDALNEINAQNQINNPSVESFPAFDPELSGYNYSVDLVNPMETPLTATELENLGYIKVENVAGSGDLAQVVDGTELKKDDVIEGATIKKGSVQNTLFGVIASQYQNDVAFLLKLEMTIRGDPWYLGKDTNDNTDAQHANFEKDHNHFYLSLRSPKTFDMDWRDEDSDINTGYWKGDGVSRTFGGIYRLIKVTNNFANGEFTSDITAQRIIPGQEPDNVGGSDKPKAWEAPSTNDPSTATDFSNGTREVYHDGMEGSALPQGWYTHYQMDHYMTHGRLPPDTQDPDG